MDVELDCVKWSYLLSGALSYDTICIWLLYSVADVLCCNKIASTQCKQLKRHQVAKTEL